MSRGGVAAGWRFAEQILPGPLQASRQSGGREKITSTYAKPHNFIHLTSQLHTLKLTTTCTIGVEKLTST